DRGRGRALRHGDHAGLGQRPAQEPGPHARRRRRLLDPGERGAEVTSIPGRRPAIWVAPAGAHDARRAAEALASEADPALVEGDGLAAQLERGGPDVLVVAGEGALDLCRSARAGGPAALPVLVLGAPLADAFAAGANDVLGT